MNILTTLRERFAAALTAMGVGEDELPGLTNLVLPSQDPKFGEYQANCAMPLGKRLGQPPRNVATQLVAALAVSDLCEPPEIAGPGFINLRLKDAWIAEQLRAIYPDTERLGVPRVASSRTVVIDFSAPNVAKPMHVGHIRSTVIGDALYRILKFLGHHVISDNHLGDWGTQFGMIIYGVKHFAQRQPNARFTVAELTVLYKQVHSLVEYHEARRDKIPALEKRIDEVQQQIAQLSAASLNAVPEDAKALTKRLRAQENTLAELKAEFTLLQSKLRAVDNDQELGRLAADHANIGQEVLFETARLHAGDATNVELWRRILPECLAELNVVYKRLGVEFDHTLGESFYHDRLHGVVKDLAAKGLAEESDGAICVFLDGFDVPMIVQKRDGAFLYATTDLATIQYRIEQWRPDAILYVVDHRQSDHFKLLFAAAKRWGITNVELEHVAFGTVLGEDGKPFKTRSGASVGLAGLLDEAVERAYTIVSQNDASRPEPLLSEEERRQVAERIGIGAIKYADLAHNRTSDYVFSYDKMLAMTGNTAAYLQYSYARVKSIFGKALADGDGHSADWESADVPILLCTRPERALAVVLLQLSETLDRVAADYRPNHLTAFLFELASRYSEFFENCPVLKAETNELRRSRLKLCNLTARTIERGLGLLGIEVVERM